MEILADTGVLINVLGKKPDLKCAELLKKIEAWEIKGFVSSITVFELYYDKLLSIFNFLDIPGTVSMKAGEIGAGLKNRGLDKVDHIKKIIFQEFLI